MGHTNLTAELLNRVTEVLTEVFGEDRVEVTPHPEYFPPQVEFGNVWISPPDEDCSEYTWGTQHHHPGSYETPPETDVEEEGSYKRMDDAIKEAVLQYARDLMDDKFLSESEVDVEPCWECDGCGQVWNALTEDGQPEGRCPACNSGFACFEGGRPQRSKGTN